MRQTYSYPGGSFSRIPWEGLVCLHGGCGQVLIPIQITPCTSKVVYGIIRYRFIWLFFLGEVAHDLPAVLLKGNSNKWLVRKNGERWLAIHSMSVAKYSSHRNFSKGFFRGITLLLLSVIFYPFLTF